MKQVGIYELKTKVSALIAEVEAAGEPIALTKRPGGGGDHAAAVGLAEGGHAEVPGVFRGGGFRCVTPDSGME